MTDTAAPDPRAVGAHDCPRCGERYSLDGCACPTATAASDGENTELEIDYTGWSRPMTTAACPEHALPLLPDEKIQAFVTLLDWPGTAAVTHACEARLVVEREWLDVYR